jgi:hypothetical protein
MYGKIVDSRGNTIVADADADMSIPPGGKFIPAPMHYFMRFAGADGMHVGYLPGYPSIARLCPDAGTVRDCVLQCSQCWHSGRGVRKDAKRALRGAIATHISKAP